MASIIKVDQLSEKTQGGGITLSHSLKLKSSGDSITASDGTTAVLSESGGVVTLNNGTIGANVSFANIADDAISGDKIYGGTISSVTLDSSNAFPVGHVLNTKYNRTKNSVTLPAGAWTNTGLNISHATASGSYVLLFGYVVVSHGYTADNSLRVRILRDNTTDIFNDDNTSEYGNGDGNESYTFKMFFNYLYNPNTTASVNYRVDVYTSSGATGQNGAYSTITLLEIKQ